MPVEERGKEGGSAGAGAGATCACFSALKAIVPSLLLLLLSLTTHMHSARKVGGDIFRAQQQMHRLC